jgi:hypothetical protein
MLKMEYLMTNLLPISVKLPRADPGHYSVKKKPAMSAGFNFLFLYPHRVE